MPNNRGDWMEEAMRSSMAESLRRAEQHLNELREQPRGEQYSWTTMNFNKNKAKSVKLVKKRKKEIKEQMIEHEFEVGQAVLFTNPNDVADNIINIAQEYKVAKVNKSSLLLEGLNDRNGIPVRVIKNRLIPKEYALKNTPLVRASDQHFGVYLFHQHRSRTYPVVSISDIGLVKVKQKGIFSIFDSNVEIAKRGLKHGDIVSLKSASELQRYDIGNYYLDPATEESLNHNRYLELVDIESIKVRSKMLNGTWGIYVTVNDDTIYVPVSFLNVIKLAKEKPVAKEGDEVYIYEKGFDKKTPYRIMKIVEVSSKRLIGVVPIDAVESKLVYARRKNCKIKKGNTCNKQEHEA